MTASASVQGNLDTLEQVQEALEDLGYRSKLQEASISVNIGHDIVASMMMKDTSKNELVVLCHVAKLGEVIPDDPEAAAGIMIQLLDRNTVIRPFALACIGMDDGEDVDPEDYPLVLVDSVSLGDFSTEELKKTMENLNRAVASAGELLAAIRSETQESGQGQQ